MSITNNTTRFSNRVADYVKYRPHYPPGIVGYLQVEYGLSSDQVIADIGSGTGISSQLFLNAGYKVWGIEPNTEMRAESVALLGSYPGFKAINGTAEQTGLEQGSVDVIIAGQAFHWFDQEKAKAEFQRILKNKGIVVLIWNERKTASPFEQEYDRLIAHYGKDYVKVKHRNIDLPDIEAFFNPMPCCLQTFSNYQDFDFEGLKGRLLSSSYIPVAGEAGYHEMITHLEKLFLSHQENGSIRIHYTTKVYSGIFNN
jgi:SAM-dependent methyltransferase